MTSTSARLGRHVMRGIDATEALLNGGIGVAADGARKATRRSGSWLAKKERVAQGARKELTRDLTRKTQRVAAVAAATNRFVKHRSWTALGLAAAATVIGMMMVRR